MDFNNNHQKDLYAFLIGYGKNHHKTLTPEELSELSHSVGAVLNLKESEIKEVVREYEIRIGVTMQHVSMLSKTADEEWFLKYKNKPTDLIHWQRYKDYLERDGFSTDTLLTMEEDIMRTIAKFADPSFEGLLSKKGLVVGDVQSGKTANYIGIINMAVDVGYRNIVLLAGMTEDLHIIYEIGLCHIAIKKLQTD